MDQRAKRFGLAVVITVLDGVVIRYRGSIAWETWSDVPLLRLILLALAGLGAFTLARIWKAAFHCPILLVGTDSNSFVSLGLFSGDTTEASDV